jgi:HK97 family phage prohead protease
MSNKFERRFTNQPVSIEGTDNPIICGYAAVFNSLSNPISSHNVRFIEKVDPHAFDDTLASNADVRALWNHNPDNVLGRTKSGTLRLSVDSVGLRYEISPPDTQFAKDLMTSMKRGDIDSSSFGFSTDKDKWDHSTTPSTRTLLKVSLGDVSPVTYPAYESASSEARSFPNGVPDSVAEAFAKTEETRNDTSDAVEAANDGEAPIDDNDECDCDCAQCEAGSCSLCSNDDCDDDNCDCQEIRAIILALEVAADLYKD